MKHKILSHGINVSYGRTLPKAMKHARKFLKRNKDIIISAIRYDVLDIGYTITTYFSYLRDEDDE